MPEWSIRAVIGTGRDVDEAACLQVQERLGVHSANVGQEPEPDRLGIQMHVEASTVRKAFELALRLIVDTVRAQGLAADVLDVRIMTGEEFKREELRPKLPPLMGVAEIAAFLDISRQRVNQLVREHPAFFQEAIRSAAGPLYSEAAVRAYAARGRAKGRPKRPREHEAASG